MRQIRYIAFFLIFLTCLSTLGSAWTPSVVLEPDHPRILFTGADSADLATRVTDPDFSSYYSSIWSRANSTSGNSTQVEDLNRSHIAVSAAIILYLGVKPGGDTLTIAERSNLETKCTDYLSEMITTMGSRLSNGEYPHPREAYPVFDSAGYTSRCGNCGTYRRRQGPREYDLR